MDRIKAQVLDVTEILRKTKVEMFDVEGIQNDSERCGRLLIKFKPRANLVFKRFNPVWLKRLKMYLGHFRFFF